MVMSASIDRDVIVRTAVEELLARLPAPKPSQEGRIRLDMELKGILRDLDKGAMSYPWHPRIRLVIQTVADEAGILGDDEDRLWDLNLYLRTLAWPLPWHQGVSGPLDDEDRAQIARSVKALYDALLNQDISAVLNILEAGCACNDVYLNCTKGFSLAAVKLALENATTTGKIKVGHWNESKLIVCPRYDFRQSRLFDQTNRFTLDLIGSGNIRPIAMPISSFKILNIWKIAR